MVRKDSLPKFDPGVYTKIALNDLIVYSIQYLHDQESEITPEDVISACFHLFPKRFSLRKYPHWPDSAVVSRRWSDCRNKKYVIGSTALGFKLTPKGSKYAAKVAKKLGIAKPARAAKVRPLAKMPVVRAKPSDKTSQLARRKKKRTIRPNETVASAPVKKAPRIRSEKTHLPVQVKEAPRSVQIEKTLPPVQADKKHPTQSSMPKEVKVRAGKFVRMLETSDAYVHYRKNGKSSKIGEFDFRSMLLCTMESSPETLARNIEQFKGYASIHSRQDLIAFLTYCEDKFSYLLESSRSKRKK